MEYIVGITFAAAVSLFASMIGLDRDRAFYPTVLIVIALLYALFSFLGTDPRVLASEAIPILIFITLAVLGFKKSAWFAVAGLVGHGIFDFFHADAIHNDGVPSWWPGFCLAYDVVAGGYLAGMLLRARTAG